MNVIAQQNDTIDAICWRYYGRSSGVVEHVLQANPGLADLGAVLPHGTAVVLPDQVPQATKQLIQLWD